MKCKGCKYIDTFRGGFECTHKDIFKSAKAYEEEKKKRISKCKSFIGFDVPKTCLRWCPLKKEQNK